VTISGHKTRSVFERYKIVSYRDISEAEMQANLDHLGTRSRTPEQLTLPDQTEPL